MTSLPDTAPGRRALRRGRSLARRATSRWRPLPDAVVIGAMKAGSTTAFALMFEHPRVRGPAHKEVHFLDRHHDRGERWYRAQFPVSGPRRRWVAVESTPYYMSYPPAPSRLRAVAPRVRLVALLRDPADRAVSQWKQRTRERREQRSLETVVAEERRLSEDDIVHMATADVDRHRRLILAHGHYAAQLRRWFAAFGREQILVVDSRRLFDDPQATMDAIFGFVGLESRPIEDGSARNAGDDRLVDDHSLCALREYYRPLNEELFELLGTRFDWR